MLAMMASGIPGCGTIVTGWIGPPGGVLSGRSDGRQTADSGGSCGETNESGGKLNATFFGLLAEFGAAEIPLEDCCLKYFSIDVPLAKRRATAYELPIAAYKANAGRNGRWMISAHDLAKYLDEQKEGHRKMFETMNAKPRLQAVGSRSA